MDKRGLSVFTKHFQNISASVPQFFSCPLPGTYDYFVCKFTFGTKSKLANKIIICSREGARKKLRNRCWNVLKMLREHRQTPFIHMLQKNSMNLTPPTLLFYYFANYFTTYDDTYPHFLHYFLHKIMLLWDIIIKTRFLAINDCLIKNACI